PYLLSQDEERVAAEKSLPGTKAWQRLHSKLTAELRIDFEGEELPPFEAAQRLGTLPERERREALARAMGVGLEPNVLSRAAALNAVIGDRVVEDRLRGYATWLSHRNLQNRISDEAVDALCEALAARVDIPERHFRLRARLLGLERLADYDRTAPV